MARSKALKNVLSLVDVEEVSVEQAFLRDLQLSIEREDAKNTRVPSRTYKPSGMNCLRGMWFQLMGVEPMKDSSTSTLIGICESGTDRHERIQKAVDNMKNHHFDCEYVDVAEYVKSHGLEETLEIKSKQGMETKLYHKELNISFLCDGIIKYKGIYYILEIKTESSNKFWNQNGVMPNHFLQGTAYSLCFGINDVIFLYENRDTCAKKCFMFHVTAEMREAIRTRIAECNQYVENNICPPKPIEAGKQMCGYCSYREECAKYV